MRILWVKAGRLLPVDTGGKSRTFNMLKYLARWNEVILLSYYSGARDQGYERELESLFPGAIGEAVPLPGKSSLRGRADYARGLMSRLPYAVYKHTAPAVRARVNQLLASHPFDVAVCDFLAPAQNFRGDFGIPTVLFEHNVESLLWARQARHQSNPLKALMYRLEAAKMLRYEQAAVRRFDHVIAVSAADGEWFRSRVGESRVSVVPTGVDTLLYTWDNAGRPDRNLIIFVGSMDWSPNVDGVLYFCRSILPLVRSRIPEARLRIVGRNPGPEITALASDFVEVTGTVDSVVPHLGEAAIVVVPLRIGGGTRLKIMEAMAMGKAIVSTTIGAEGLELKPGSEIILADRPAEFAAAVISLMQNDTARGELEANAAALAQGSGWENAAAAFQQALVKVVDGGAAARGTGVQPGAGRRSGAAPRLVTIREDGAR